MVDRENLEGWQFNIDEYGDSSWFREIAKDYSVLVMKMDKRVYKVRFSYLIFQDIYSTHKTLLAAVNWAYETYFQFLEDKTKCLRRNEEKRIIGLVK